MSSLASEVKVANLALTDLGADRIIALDEDSENARKVNAVFDLLRDSVLRSHPWNFAIERRSFNQTTNTPAFGYDSEFQIPGDVLRILTAENRNYDEWVKEGDKILVNDTSFKCRCIVRVADPTKWDENFVTVFAARLAAELAYSITDSRPVAADKWELYRKKYREATGVDAQEGTPQELLVDEWLDSRSGGVITPRAE
jgi:hypothetical protein